MIPISVALDLDCFVILEITEKLPQILTAIIGQNENHFLNVFQIIYKTTEHLTVSINQRLDVLQIVCVDVIVKEREEWYLSNSVLIAIRIFAQLRINQEHLIRNQLIQLISRLQPVRHAFLFVPVLINGIAVASFLIEALVAPKHARKLLFQITRPNRNDLFCRNYRILPCTFSILPDMQPCDRTVRCLNAQVFTHFRIFIPKKLC